MTDLGAVLRARVGAALRAQPSELDRRRRRPVVGGDADPAAVAEAEALARQLETDAPGLALMLQLRSRFFDRAVRDARRRGLRRLVAVACGLDDRRLAAAAAAGVRVADVDTPGVLSLKRAPLPGVQRFPVPDLGASTWMRGEAAAFYLVQNAAFWLGERSVDALLARLAVEAPAGSEALLNWFLGDRDRLPAALGRLGLVTDDPRPTRGLVRGLEAVGLEPVAVLDSCELQRRYLDCEDLLLRELFVWVRTPGGSRARAAVSVLPPRRHGLGDERLPPLDERPRVRPAAHVETDSTGGGAIWRFVTPARCVGVRLDPVGLAATLQLDGRRTLRQVADALSKARRGRVHERVRRIAASLRAACLLDERCALAALAGQAFAALRARDPARARVVDASLAGATGNRSARHLRGLLARIDAGDDGWLFLAQPPVYAVTHAGDAGAAALLAAAGATLGRIAALLAAPGVGPVLIDALAERPGIPLTWTGVDRPYTLIRIPRPMLTRAVLAHELTHALAMPRSRWLAEGLAVWMQRYVVPGEAVPFVDAATGPAHRWPAGTLARLLAPVEFGTRPEAITVAQPASYGLAAAFVSFLVERYGLATLRALLHVCARGATEDAIDRVWVASGGEALGRVEERWRGRLARTVR